MIITPADAKSYLRIDAASPEDAALLQLLIDAAETYLRNATGKQFDSGNRLACLFCLVLVADWYENREMVGKVGERVRFTVQSLLAQLTYCLDPEVTP